MEFVDHGVLEQMNFPFVALRVKSMASYISSSFWMKFISSQKTTCKLGPRMVSGLLGKASMIELLERCTIVF